MQASTMQGITAHNHGTCRQICSLEQPAFNPTACNELTFMQATSPCANGMTEELNCPT